MPLPRRGRPAREAPPAHNIAKTMAQTVCFWGVFLFLLPWLIVEGEALLGDDWVRLPPPRVLGACIFAFFGAISLTSGVVMAITGAGTPMPQDCARHLVLTGPYRFVRNPMALAGIAQGVGVGLWLGSVGVLVYAVCGAIVWNTLVRPWEEADLSERFGDEFRRYQASVRCWVPRLRPYTPHRPKSRPEDPTP